jgi:hypothetical protein
MSLQKIARMDYQRVFLIEFNELSPALLDRFIAAGDLPNFSAFRATSDVFTTDAGELEPTLVPWIQWPSIHTGLSYAEHKIFNLGDAGKCNAPTVESVLSDSGVPVGIFGSMKESAGLDSPTHGIRRPAHSQIPFNPITSRRLAK